MSGEYDDDTTTAGIVAETIPQGSSEQAYLLVLAGSRVGEMVRIEDGLSIGRAPEAAFVINDHGISRVHLRIHRKGDNLELRDLGSTNGTYVNGIKIDTATLRDGDKIHIGSTTILKFSHADNLEESFQQRMYEAALCDPLTQLYNRRYLMQQLASEISYARRHHTPLCLVMMDIDHFKSINDRYGHPVGDVVLCGFAQKLKETIRDEDLAARYGGEEFALVCRGVNIMNGVIVANRIRSIIEGAQLVSEHPELKVTISAGIAGLPEPRIVEINGLISAADKALYEAKRTGRNRVCIYK